MKILAPVNKSGEVERIIKAGADEIYCGVLPDSWMKKYTNVASPNRREWTAANLKDFGELGKVVDIAHTYHIPVYLTVNAFYTEEQYPLILEQIDQTRQLGVDAFIIGDLGLILSLKENNLNINFHISNTATVFNSEAVRFYKKLGASRIILPRQLTMDEIAESVNSENDIEFEVFIMNSGCKNIDGFCTFHHGVNEILHPQIWNLFKKLGFDHYLLESVRRMPFGLSRRLKGDIFGIDSACLLNYRISLDADQSSQKDMSSVFKAISSGFNLLSGADPCGSCDLYRLKKIGVNSIKIVGRNYPTLKKVKDVKFLKKLLLWLEGNPFMTEEEFRADSRAGYKSIYKTNCNNLCYRFNAG
jgi:collagenase-like PrtC family protease